MHVIILAGGGGTRLWPLSKQDFPKQFLRFHEKYSLLQKSVSRFLDNPIAKTILVATNRQYEPLVRKQLEVIDPEQKVHILTEPARKNTAPAMAFALKYLHDRLGALEEDPVLVLPSDHLIEPQDIFMEALKRAVPWIKNQHLLLFGITPTKPETGYGYIQAGKQINSHTFAVKRFVEKPDLTLAKSYLASGDYYWNSGMFAFSIALFWKYLKQYAPGIAKLWDAAPEDVETLFQELPEISFDYAVLEKCKEILVSPMNVNWSDVGCWDSVYDVMEKDSNQNAKQGNIFDIDTRNSLILGGKKLISTIGLDDLLIVDTEEATFIGKRGESQKIREVVQHLHNHTSSSQVGNNRENCFKISANDFSENNRFDSDWNKQREKGEISMKKTALFSGSFDPPTIGHLDIIRRSSLVCTHLIVAIGENSGKTPLFTVAQRLEMLREITKSYSYVQVDSFKGLTVEYAKSKKVDFLLRSIRNLIDLEQESQMALANSLIGNLETVFLVGKHPQVKSSLIREILRLGGSVDALVPPEILKLVTR